MAAARKELLCKMPSAGGSLRFTGIVWAGLRTLLWYPLLMLYAGDVLAKIQFYLVQSKQVCYTACARTAKFHAKLQKKPVRILD